MSRPPDQDWDFLITLLEHCLAGYWDWYIQENEEYLSPAFKEMFGYADDELPNSPDTWKQLIFPEDLPGVLDMFNKHVESHGEVPYYNEVRYRHKNGSTVWVICTGKVIEWDENGQAARMVGCHIDITKRKEAEIALKENEERQRAIVDTMADGMVTIDGRGIIESFNHAAQQIFDYDAAEVIGRNATGSSHVFHGRFCSMASLSYRSGDIS